MNVTEIIDEVLQRTDNIRGAPADYADRRTRLLVYLREVQDELWWLRDWPWRMKRSTVTFPANVGYVTVPADFHDWGHDGTLYGVDHDPLDVVPERVILDMRERGFTTATPDRYAIFGMDDSGMAPTYRKLIQIPTNTIALTLGIWYMSTPPTLDEAANVEAINRIPAQYHRRVVVPGVRYKAERSKSDARAEMTKGEYEEGKASMLQKESRDANKMTRLQSFFNYRSW